MRIYAVAGSKANVVALADRGYRSVLVSFAHDPDGVALDMLAGTDTKVMIDSGAFTAWTSRACRRPRRVRELRDRAARTVPRRCRRQPRRHPGHRDEYRHHRPGTEAGRGDVAANAEQLRAAGIPVCEVFHMQDPFAELDAILERRRPGERIAFGGLAQQKGGGQFNYRQWFCRKAFRHLVDRLGIAGVPLVHGLGVSPDGQIGGGRFPWASVDCSSWMSIGQYGIHVARDGKRSRGGSDSRVGGSTEMRVLYETRVLDRWRLLEPNFTRLWSSRGFAVE